VGNERQEDGRDFEVDLHGNRYFGNTASHIDWHVFYFGEFDPVGINFLRFIVQRHENPVFLDIGANAGTHTLAVAKFCEQIHCFEPYPLVLESLRKNVEANDLGNVTIHEFGLSSQSRQADFFENKYGNFGAGTFQSLNREPDFCLPLRRGDTVFPDLGISRIDVIKIDVEGHEFEVLTGIRKHLDRTRPIVLWELNEGIVEQIREPLISYFPDDYQIFRLSFRGRWRRKSPSLVNLDSLTRGNLVSIPNEKLSLAKGTIYDA
jgi:FkbM family methyltransferase